MIPSDVFFLPGVCFPVLIPGKHLPNILHRSSFAWRLHATDHSKPRGDVAKIDDLELLGALDQGYGDGSRYDKLPMK